MQVYSADNQNLGHIAEVYPDSFLVHKGFFFPKDRYIPYSAIKAVEDDRGALELYHNRHLDLLSLLRLLTLNPAQILRLPVGRLAVGAPADLVLFDPDLGWLICPDEFRSKSKNAPFDGRPVQGRVQRTIVDGRLKIREPVVEAGFEMPIPALGRHSVVAES